MITAKMKLLHSLLLLLFVNTLFAQTRNDTIFHTATQRLQIFQQTIPQEKVYIHQDRTVYMAGETIWFKAYQHFSEGIEKGSNVLYVNLVDNNNQLIFNSKWYLENGTTSGCIELADTLTSGHYQLQAYTQWMQNFDLKNCFTREIQIFSPHVTSSKDSIATFPPQLSFFPEGGNLVEGIPSRIAFIATGKHGKGLDVSGSIIDQEGNEAQRFQTLHNGQGYFHLVPEANKQYIARLDNYSGEVPIPQPYPKGIVMNIKYRDDKVRITLKHNLVGNSPPLYLMAHQEGNTFINTYVEMNEPTIVLDIPNNKLPDGIFTLTIYDEQLQVYCERLIFVNYPEQIDLHISNNEHLYKRRKIVTLQVEAKNKEGFRQVGNFSLAVIKSGLDNPDNRTNFYTHYFLQNELKGQIEQPASYFEKKDLTALRKLDLLLMTHGWRKYEWNDIMLGNLPKIYYPIENGLSFSGKVKMNRRQKTENISVTAFFRQDSINDISFNHPENDGSFLFTNYHFYDTAEVILSATNDKGSILDLAIKEPLSGPGYYHFSNNNLFNDSLLVEMFGSIPNLSKNIDKKIHELPDIIITAKTTKQKQTQAQRHLTEHILSSYKTNNKFSYSVHTSTDPSISGALAILEYIPQAKKLTIFGESALNSAKIEPFYILDGRRVDQKTIASTSAESIDRVELLSPTAAMIYGGGSFAGAIAFYTKKGYVKNSEQEKHTIYKFPGYNQSKEFYSPDYSFSNEFIDFDNRNTILWIPTVTFDEEGKSEISFYTSDEVGEYIIHCEGISENNMIGVFQSKFTVF